MTIEIIRLTTGEEFITEVGFTNLEEGQVLTLSNPCILHPEVSAGGNVKVNMFPAALFSKDRTVNVNSDQILWTSEPTDEVKEAYQNRFNKIVTPPKKEIILG